MRRLKGAYRNCSSGLQLLLICKIIEKNDGCEIEDLVENSCLQAVCGNSIASTRVRFFFYGFMQEIQSVYEEDVV